MSSSPIFGEYIALVSKRNFVDGASRRFKVKIKAEEVHGFVVRKAGKFYAYQNLCQHFPVTLDLNDGNFFTHDKEQLQCHLHGAIYEVETGYCVAGPCLGANLVRLALEEEDDRLVIHIPEDILTKS